MLSAVPGRFLFTALRLPDKDLIELPSRRVYLLTVYTLTSPLSLRSPFSVLPGLTHATLPRYRSDGEIEELVHELRSIYLLQAEAKKVATICTCLFGVSAHIAGNYFAPLAMM